MFPIYPIEFMGLITLPVLMALCTIAGIGGGGIVIPCLMAFFIFDTKKAIAISGFTILTCSVTRYIYGFKAKHPDKDAV